ncbi:unnamed protein product [Mytilus coruscus]|uniref:Uncharacterized protein n=1 Tax=Mytilus coruscus TaxID=42192 RepID=A0A6J8ALI6_MYTCO|nr:unnamed protein product [Mytilus coruscus]
MDSITILSLDNMGIRMCIREGMRVKSCNGINYWNNRLQCTLVSVSVCDHLINSAGHVYTDLSSWTMSYGRDGVWPGYYVYNGVQYPWSMSIQFNANSITGGGSDSIGNFTIGGSWNPLSKDINFVKAYTTHTVSCTGQVTDDVCTMHGQYEVGSTTGPFNMTICT